MKIVNLDANIWFSISFLGKHWFESYSTEYMVWAKHKKFWSLIMLLFYVNFILLATKLAVLLYFNGLYRWPIGILCGSYVPTDPSVPIVNGSNHFNSFVPFCLWPIHIFRYWLILYITWWEKGSISSWQLTLPNSECHKLPMYFNIGVFDQFQLNNGCKSCSF